jgi:putative sigma-54 modulation protein
VKKEVLMNLTISGHHLEVTPALRESVLTKLERVTRHFDQVVDVNVLLTVEKLKEKERRQRAEVTLHIKGKDIFVEQSNEDMYAAIDQLMDKLDRQVCRHKDRLQDHHHSTGKRLDVGLKLKGVAPAGRLGSAAGWNEMLTHRVSLSSADEADAELVAWLKAAYDGAAKG